MRTGPNILTVVGYARRSAEAPARRDPCCPRPMVREAARASPSRTSSSIDACIQSDSCGVVPAARCGGRSRTDVETAPERRRRLARDAALVPSVVATPSSRGRVICHETLLVDTHLHSRRRPLVGMQRPIPESRGCWRSWPINTVAAISAGPTAFNESTRCRRSVSPCRSQPLR